MNFRVPIALSFASLLPACELAGFSALGLDGSGGSEETTTSGSTPRPVDPPDCTTLNFDKRFDGTPIDAATVLNNIYEPRVQLDITRGDGERGLGVAFDSKHPTGRDYDLKFRHPHNLKNLLISQECFDDLSQTRVHEPDDDAQGALFRFTFDPPVCVRGLTVLDIDLDEDAVEIEFLDTDDVRVGPTVLEAPLGNNERQDIVFDGAPSTECIVTTMTVRLSSSGALDNLQFCDGVPETPTDLPPPPLNEVDRDGGSGNDVATDANDVIWVAGQAETDGTPRPFLGRYRPDGTFMDDVAGSFEGADGILTSVAIGPDNNVVVTGYVERAGTGRDIVVRRYTNDGTVSGTFYSDEEGNAMGNAIAVDDDGTVFVTGDVAAGGQGQDLWAARFNPGDDTPDWAESLVSEDGQDTGFGIDVGTNGRVYITGRITAGMTAPVTEANLWVGLVDRDDGTVLESDVFDNVNAGDDIGRGIAVANDGRVYVIGDTPSSPLGTDIIVLRYESDLTGLETTLFNGGPSDSGFDVTYDATSGDILTVGSTLGSESMTLDVWLRRYDADLVARGTTIHDVLDSGSTDSSFALTLDGFGRTIATGTSDDGASGPDIWVGVFEL